MRFRHCLSLSPSVPFLFLSCVTYFVMFVCVHCGARVVSALAVVTLRFPVFLCPSVSLNLTVPLLFSCPSISLHFPPCPSRRCVCHRSVAVSVPFRFSRLRPCHVLVPVYFVMITPARTTNHGSTTSLSFATAFSFSTNTVHARIILSAPTAFSAAPDCLRSVIVHSVWHSSPLLEERRSPALHPFIKSAIVLTMYSLAPLFGIRLSLRLFDNSTCDSLLTAL